ncbi:AI-2E family transporter [bacterium]|nr:AI-2E family transporter [bacterium]
MSDIFKKYITVKNIIFFILAILTLIFISKIKDIAIMFFASYVIACSLNPIVDKLTERKMKRSIASALVLIGSILIAALFLVPIFVIVAYQIKAFILALPSHFGTIHSFIMERPFLNNTLLDKSAIGSMLSSTVNVTTGVVNTSIEFVMNIASQFVYVIAACLIIYYFMADKEEVSKAYMSLFPRNMKRKAEEIMETISKKIGGYMIALIVTIASVGVVMTTGLLILGVDYAVLLGLITAILDIVPVIGPAIALIIALLVSFKAGWVTILMIIVVFSLAQLIENNFVRPFVFGKMLNLHPLIIYFFIFITAQYLGVVGVIFAPAIAATACVLIEELYIKNIN